MQKDFTSVFILTRIPLFSKQPIGAIKKYDAILHHKIQASFGHASRQCGGAHPVVQNRMRDLTLKSIANEKLDLEINSQ